MLHSFLNFKKLVCWNVILFLLSMLYWLIKLFFIHRMQGRVCITLFIFWSDCIWVFPIHVPDFQIQVVWTQEYTFGSIQRSPCLFLYILAEVFKILNTKSSVTVHLIWWFCLKFLQEMKICYKHANKWVKQPEKMDVIKAVNITQKKHVFSFICFFFLIKKVFCTLYNSSFGVLFDFF